MLNGILHILLVALTTVRCVRLRSLVVTLRAAEQRGMPVDRWVVPMPFSVGNKVKLIYPKDPRLRLL